MKVYSVTRLANTFDSHGEIECICATEELAQRVKAILKKTDDDECARTNEKNYVRYIIAEHTYITA
jgi:hypothetical protein